MMANTNLWKRKNSTELCNFVFLTFYVIILIEKFKGKVGDSMPVKKTKSGGYKYGSSGKTYYGKGAKARTTKQGRAIAISKKKKK